MGLGDQMFDALFCWYVSMLPDGELVTPPTPCLILFLVPSPPVAVLSLSSVLLAHWWLLVFPPCCVDLTAYKPLWLIRKPARHIRVSVLHAAYVLLAAASPLRSNVL